MKFSHFLIPVVILISLSARREPAMRRYAETLRERVVALGRAHDFVRPHSDESRRTDGPATVFAMLGELFAPYGEAGVQRVRLQGDDAPIDDRSATPTDAEKVQLTNLLAENMEDVVWKTSRELVFTYINDADRRLRGFPLAEVLGRPIEDTLTEHGKALLEAERGGRDMPSAIIFATISMMKNDVMT